MLLAYSTRCFNFSHIFLRLQSKPVMASLFAATRRCRLPPSSAVPETIFVDSQGNILGDGTQFIGARSYESWKGIIDSFLASLPG